MNQYAYLPTYPTHLNQSFYETQKDVCARLLRTCKYNTMVVLIKPLPCPVRRTVTEMVRRTSGQEEG